jgi:lactate dehydrogenase-like 2-hydroxyacid dehydrogenase
MMVRPKILLTRHWPAAVERHLLERYDVTLNERDIPLTSNALCDAMRNHDALCPTVTDTINAEILETPGARVRIIGNYGVGINHIDIEAAQRTDIIVTNTPDVLTDATADLAILLILMSTRRAGEGERELRAHRWTGWRPTHLPGQGLSGKTLGLVGFGRIAQAAARRAHRGFGMQIAYHSRRRATTQVENETQARYVESVDALVAQCDVLSLHCPGGPETYHLIDQRRLALMKRTAVLVNTARGSVIDEAALAEALDNGTIAAAGLDVYEREPEVNAKLMTMENVVLLPHLGSATVETRIAMGMRVAANLERFFAGDAPPDKVNSSARGKP